MPKKVASEKVNDGVKLNIPIRIFVDKDLVNEENVIVDEKRRMSLLIW